MFHDVEDENKLATILFADIVDSSAVVEDLPADAALDVLRGALEAMGAAVARHGGTVTRVMGDGVMALFGAPQAREDHALAACLAAREMLEAVGAGFPGLALRVGLHSGEFVVHAVQSGNLSALDATGSAAHLAARIQAAAAPGECWVSEATRALAGEAATTAPLGEVALKGQRAPARLHRLLGARAARRPAREEAPLLGRAAELRRLRAALAEARAGRGRALLVLGEPGLGKTRLLGEALRPAAPLLRVVALRLRARHDFAALEGALGEDWAPPPDPAHSPRERRAALVEAAVAALEARLRTPGAALWVDDAQWLDEGSAEALRALLRRAAPLPALLAFAARSGEAPPWLDATERLELPPLAEAAARELALWGLGGSAPGEVVGTLVARCGGNPLCIEQAALAPDPRAIPPDIRVLLAQRLDALPAPAKRLMAVLAAIEEPCAPALLDACAGEPAAPLLEALEAGGFLRREGALAACRHALFAEVAYGALTARRRVALHARICAAAGGAHPAFLARHARLGCLWPEALVHARAAAEGALARFAHRDAAAFLEEAIEAARHADPAAELPLLLLLREPLFRLGRMEPLRAALRRAEALAGDSAQLAQLRIFRSHQAWLGGAYAEALAAVEDVAAQAAQEGDAALALRARFQRGLWALGVGRFGECAALMAEVAAGAEAHGGRFGLDAPLVVVARGYQARCLVELGEVAAARAAADAATAKAREVERPFSWIFAAYAECVVLRGEGRPAEAAARAAEGLEQCVRAETELMRVVGLLLLGLAEFEAGRWAAAERHLGESIALGEAMRFLVHQPLKLARRAEALRRLGRAGEAADCAARALALARQQGDAAGEAAALAAQPSPKSLSTSTEAPTAPLTLT
ncbi:AAA family ATPase [Roseococcus sp. DSY-14]|uniref:AAA family ATPase n=1 Tax=Roseococcus sp. DSY-14 TaxID=3369650 RepID=UPI00387B2853